MFKFQYCFVLFLCFSIIVSSVNAASFIKPCKTDDKECQLSSAQAAVSIVAAGLSEYGIKKADPIKINSVASDEAGLKITFSNIDISGVSKAKIISIERDPKKQTIKLDIENPIDTKGQYDLNGKILILEAKGKGDFSIKTDKIISHVLLRYKIIEKNGESYWKITGYDYTYDLAEKFYIKLDNLFGGNKQLADPINQLLDEEWKAIVDTIGANLIKKIIGEYVNIIKDVFLAIPSKELEIV